MSCAPVKTLDALVDLVVELFGEEKLHKTEFILQYYDKEAEEFVDLVRGFVASR